MKAQGQMKEGKMNSKGQKVSGEFTLVRSGSACMGAMSSETPYIVIIEDATGREFSWWSDKLGWYPKNVQLWRAREGTKVTLTGFARPYWYGETHLYNVKVTKVGSTEVKA